MKDDGIYSEEHTVSFSEKRWYEHLRDFGRFLPGEIVAFITLVISLWGVTEVMAQIVNNPVPLKDLVLPVLAVSSIVITYKAYSKYRSYVPDLLRDESKIVQQIFWKQKCGWQFALARQMMRERIQEHESTLARIESGAEFIPPKTIPSDGYLAWLNKRPETVIRLIRSVAIQCTSELPRCLAQASSEEHLGEVKRRVLALVNLYEQAKDFEMECHQIVPPEAFANVHEMTYGWTEPIREGVQEFMRILEKLSSIDVKMLKAGAVEPPSFSIMFEPPSNLDEFCKRLGETDSAQIHT